MDSTYLACDLGAESGRLMLGTLGQGRVNLEELHRFPNIPVAVGESLHWNFESILAGVREGLRRAGARGLAPSSFSADSWGVDYLLLDAEGRVMAPTFHYRDPRTARGVKRAHDLLGWPLIFSETGIQFMPLNTLYQLAAEDPGRLAAATRIVGVGDGINHLMGGEAVVEESMASTFALYNPMQRDWSDRLITGLGLPRAVFPRVVRSGTRLGFLDPAIAAAAGLGRVEILAGCSHDTGAAVAAVPATGGSWAYLSSGTWSLMGVERSTPILSERCRDLNYTNEIGFGGSIRLLKNIVGLWLVQECRREWARAGTDLDYATLTRLAAEAEPFRSLVDPTDSRFIAPGDMPAKIAGFCRETGQPAPESPGATIRCVLESLAMQYRRTLAELETLVGEPLTRLHVVGGGSRNGLLNQFTAEATGIEVLAGPVEATALGNVLIQAITLGHLDGLGSARQVVRDSFAIAPHHPTNPTAWAEGWDRFQTVLSRKVTA